MASNGLLTAAGYGKFLILVDHVSYGLNIIGVAEQTAKYKYFYARQVQTDTFSINVIFTTSTEREAFFKWFIGFAQLAISPSSVGTMRVQVTPPPAPGSTNGYAFDMQGTPTTGVIETTTPKDVTWPMTIAFNGAFFTGQNQYVNDPVSSIYQASADQTAGKYFYPDSNALNKAAYNPAAASAQSLSSIQLQMAVQAIDQGNWSSPLLGG